MIDDISDGPGDITGTRTMEVGKLDLGLIALTLRMISLQIGNQMECPAIDIAVANSDGLDIAVRCSTKSDI